MKNNTAIILVLLSIGLSYTFTNAQYQDVKDLQALANEYQNVLRNISAIVELRDRLFVAYEAFPPAELDRINKVLPDNIDTVRLALDIDGMASRYGISIKNIQATTGADQNASAVILPESSGGYGKATVSFGFVANYQNFMSLLGDLEKNLRIMNINAISFESGDSGLYDYKVSVETYWLK